MQLLNTEFLYCEFLQDLRNLKKNLQLTDWLVSGMQEEVDYIVFLRLTSVVGGLHHFRFDHAGEFEMLVRILNLHERSLRCILLQFAVGCGDDTRYTLWIKDCDFTPWLCLSKPHWGKKKKTWYYYCVLIKSCGSIDRCHHQNSASVFAILEFCYICDWWFSILSLWLGSHTNVTVKLCNIRLGGSCMGGFGSFQYFCWNGPSDDTKTEVPCAGGGVVCTCERTHSKRKTLCWRNSVAMPTLGMN